MDFLTNNPFYRLYYFINYDLQDPKTIDYALMMRPLSVLLVLIIYNFGCLKWGPRLMEKRKPFDLRNIIIAYDIFQIAANSYIFYVAVYDVGWFTHYNPFCGELDKADNPMTPKVFSACHYYFLLKLSDMLDTVFMVLKKKNKHISFLHMYHHTGMVILTYTQFKFVPGGHHTCLGLYNSFVHMVMYSYYLCAALYPKVDWFSFKKLVTKLQMIQFGLLGAHMCTPLLVPGCTYPKWILIIFVPNNVLMFFLFYDFYRKTYILKKKKPQSNTKKE